MPALPYALGVDLGTTFTAAAVARAGRAEIVTLGDHAPELPSVLFLREDGEFLVGGVADRRSIEDPSRVVRDVKRRFGDQVPVLLGGVPFATHVLMGKLLRFVVDEVTKRQGRAPQHRSPTMPAGWGPLSRGLLQQGGPGPRSRRRPVLARP